MKSYIIFFMLLSSFLFSQNKIAYPLKKTAKCSVCRVITEAIYETKNHRTYCYRCVIEKKLKVVAFQKKKYLAYPFRTKKQYICKSCRVAIHRGYYYYPEKKAYCFACSQKDIPEKIRMKFSLIGRDKKLRRVWEKLKEEDSIYAYKRFIRKYPKSRYAKKAKRKIWELSIENAWKHAKLANDIESYRIFIKRYPKSFYAYQAKERMNQLKSGVLASGTDQSKNQKKPKYKKPKYKKPKYKKPKYTSNLQKKTPQEREKIIQKHIKMLPNERKVRVFVTVLGRYGGVSNSYSYVTTYGARAMGKLKDAGKYVIEPLQKYIKGKPKTFIALLRAARVLAYLGVKEGIDILIQHRNHKVERYKYEVAKGFTDMKDKKRSLPYLLEYLKNPEPKMLNIVLGGLHGVWDPKIIDPLIHILKNRKKRYDQIPSLLKKFDRTMITKRFLEVLTSASSSEKRYDCLLALYKIKAYRFMENSDILLPFLKDTSEKVKVYSLKILIRARNKNIPEICLKLLSHKNKEIVRLSVGGVRKYPKAIPKLVRMLNRGYTYAYSALSYLMHENNPSVQMEIIHLIRPLLKHKNEKVLVKVINLYKGSKNPEYVSEVAHLINKKNVKLVYAVMKALSVSKHKYQFPIIMDRFVKAYKNKEKKICKEIAKHMSYHTGRKKKNTMTMEELIEWWNKNKGMYPK